jgi:hypothetical protein
MVPLHLFSYKQHYAVPELITFNLSIITFSLSRTTVEVSHVAAGEHMVPGPFHIRDKKGFADKFDLPFSDVMHKLAYWDPVFGWKSFIHDVYSMLARALQNPTRTSNK